MYLEHQKQLAGAVRAFLREKYQIEMANVVIAQPPSVELGEFALPLSFELAKRLRKPPRKIAEEIAAEMKLPSGFEKLEVAGAGYINARLKRDEAAKALAHGGAQLKVASHAGEGAADVSGKILVEHTSINPNKAAHIGHLRNAILGDSFVRLLRAAGHTVDVQNYIDNTGVQVADVVVGFTHLEKKSKQEIAEMIASNPRFDYYCWDLYARVSQWYEQDKGNLKTRGEALHAIEQGGNEMAEIADLISTAVLATASGNDGPARHRVRLPAARERDPPSALLGVGLRVAKAEGRPLFRDRGQEQGLLGDDATQAHLVSSGDKGESP